MDGGGDGAGGYVPRELLEQLVDDLTVDDVRRAQEEYPEGSTMRSFSVVFYAARRLGHTLEAEDAVGYMARVRLKDVAPILKAAAEALPNEPSGRPISQPSADTGA